MSPDTATILVGCQLLLDVLLLVLIYAVHRRLKAFGPNRLNAILASLANTEQLCEALKDNLGEKAELVRQIERFQMAGATGTLHIQPQGALSPTGPADDLQRPRVLSLWDEGRTADEIAKETGMAVSEVELLVSLAKAAEPGR